MLRLALRACDVVTVQERTNISRSVLLTALSGIAPRHDSATGIPVRSHHLSGLAGWTAVNEHFHEYRSAAECFESGRSLVLACTLRFGLRPLVFLEMLPGELLHHCFNYNLQRTRVSTDAAELE